MMRRAKRRGFSWADRPGQERPLSHAGAKPHPCFPDAFKTHAPKFIFDLSPAFPVEDQ